MRTALLMTAALLSSAAIAKNDAALIAENANLPDGRRLGRGIALCVVDASRQRMVVSLGGATNLGYRVSTASAGLGEKAGSNQTPRGWHRVAVRIGKGAPVGQVFKARAAVPGKILNERTWQNSQEDLVVSRILWLDGLEPGFNKGKGHDSKSRYVYIHGTGQEAKLGTPASHGCIRMANRDVVALFDLLEPYNDIFVRIVE